MKLNIIACALLIPIAQANQRPLLADDSTKEPEPERHRHVETPVHTQAITTIDILSSSPNHSTFLHLLQRTKLIPTLNLVQGSSIFAPTDEAWSAWGEAQDASMQLALSLQSDLDVADNVLFGLRQHLLYHVLNYTLHDDSAAAETVSTAPHITTETTLLYPGRSIMSPSPHRPPTGPPWMPQGGDGDLGGSGQQLRICYAGGQPTAIGCSVDGQSGSAVWDGWLNKKKSWTDENSVHGKEKNRSAKPDSVVRHASNGVVIGIQQVLQPPPKICKVPSVTSLYSGGDADG
jgi:solute carrier family 25 carnitine/acylcarnitine transporter 20/29